MTFTTTNPINTLRDRWLEAKKSEDPNARYCTLATQESLNHQPRMRTLVLRDIDQTSCLLFVQKNSQKNLEPLNNSHWELMLFYPTLMEQYRVRGTLDFLSPEQLHKHWQNKPYYSKLLDIYYQRYQHQSTGLNDRSDFEEKIKMLSKEFPEGFTLEPPEGAIGIKLYPDYIEMWQASEDAMHHRDLYTLQGEQWQHQALVP